MERGQIKLVSIFAAVAFFVMFSIRGQDLPFSVIECIGSSITAGVFANILYKKLVWRLSRFTGVPNLTSITEVVFEFNMSWSQDQMKQLRRQDTIENPEK